MSHQPLQERILAVLAKQGPILGKELGHWLKDVDSIALDCALLGLQRANKVSLALKHYDLIRPLAKPGAPHTEAKTPQVAAPPPTAAEEAAASLQAEIPCTACGVPKAPCYFRMLPNGKRAGVCNLCHGKKTKAGQVKKAERAAQTPAVNGSGESSLVARNTELAAQAAAAPALSGGEVPSAPQTASDQPMIADRVLERVKAQRQEALNKIALLQVGLANQQSVIARCDQFTELYEQFAEGAEQ